METYEKMRIFADSWGLLFMTLTFLTVVVMTFWPGSSRAHRESADIPFRNEDRPIADSTPAEGGQQ